MAKIPFFGFTGTDDAIGANAMVVSCEDEGSFLTIWASRYLTSSSVSEGGAVEASDSVSDGRAVEASDSCSSLSSELAIRVFCDATGSFLTTMSTSDSPSSSSQLDSSMMAAFRFRGTSHVDESLGPATVIGSVLICVRVDDRVGFDSCFKAFV